MEVRYSTVAHFSTESPHHVRQTLCPCRRAEPKTHLRVGPLVDHVADRQRILVLWEALWQGSRPALD
jgi:hypothetical protein